MPLGAALAGRSPRSSAVWRSTAGPQAVDITELVLDSPQVTPMSRAIRLPETAVGSPVASDAIAAVINSLSRARPRLFARRLGATSVK